MKHDKPLIRRTFLQERFMILIERQQAGEATFAELTELDELVNRDPKLRDIILEEMGTKNSPLDKPFKEEVKKANGTARQTLLQRIWSFVNSFHLFYKSISNVRLDFRA